MKNIHSEQCKKIDAWEFAFGLIKVDDLKPSDFLKELSQMEIDGKINTKEILNIIIKKYKVGKST
jgi:hypothetical protein